MAKYSELISKFDKIRHYTRDFLVYGYHTRSGLKNTKKRSYDNEKRRIMSYLSAYVEEENTVLGKQVTINITPEDIIDNPFYALWETKSFTDNDIFLHFVILDILTKSAILSLNDIYDAYAENYCIHSELLDIMTVRNKLNKLVRLGVVIKSMQGKTLQFSLMPNLFSAFTQDERNRLKTLIAFHANAAPLGVLGYHLKNKLDNGESVDIRHKHRYLFHTLESDMMYQAIVCIKARSLCEVKVQTRKGETLKKVCPLKIYINQKHGRAYLIVYDYARSNFFSLRLDKLLAIKAVAVEAHFTTYLNKLSKTDKNAWSIYFEDHKELERVELTLSINEQKEQYILHRLKLEGKHGDLTKIEPNVFKYTIDVVDTYEMLPWIRTFLGRIIRLEGSNQQAIKLFQADFESMLKKYKL